MDNSQNATSPFATPDAGNLSTGKQEFFPVVEYSTMKTPANFVSDVTNQKAAEARASCKLGFHYYDKAAAQRVAIDKFSFVVLEVYSAVEGSRETYAGSGTWISYFSNYVKNSKDEQFALFEKGVKRQIATGFYQGKQNDGDFAKLIGTGGNVYKIPDGAGFQQHFIVYWIEGQRVMDLRLTTMVSREIKAAISRAEATAGRKVKADRVNLFALADGGAFWGFAPTKFRRINKDGGDYDGKGEMYLVPEFVSGVVKTEGAGANPELWATCNGYQTEIRASYEAEKARRAKFGTDNATTAADDPGQTATAPSNIPAGGDQHFPAEELGGGGIDFAKRTNQPAPPVSTGPAPDDDLPF